MPQPTCPNCIMGKILKSYHEKSATIAKRDAVTQGKLATESLLEKKLFEQAQVYAGEAAAEEKQAKEASIQLQEHANKAALARQKMIRTENQVLQSLKGQISSDEGHLNFDLSQHPFIERRTLILNNVNLR